MRSRRSPRPPTARTPPSAPCSSSWASSSKELQGLRDEKEKLEEVGAERERGTAKGRTFEEAVADSVDAIALRQGDVAEAVGDQLGASGKTGDVVVDIGACDGPARGRVVFEAKDRRLSKPRALEELDRALGDRDADFAVLVVPTAEELPAKLEPLREYNGDKLLVALDPDDPDGLALEVGYRLARARVLMARGGQEGVDGAAVHDVVERALHAMDDVRKVKSQLTGAKTGIDRAYEVVEEMAARVRAHLAEVDALVLAASPGDAPELTAQRDRPARALGELEVAARALAIGTDAQDRGLDLLRHRGLAPGAHLVVAGLEGAPDGGGVRGRHRPHARVYRPPSSVIVCGSSVWLAIVISTGPAPTSEGETVTLLRLDHAGELERPRAGAGRS